MTSYWENAGKLVLWQNGISIHQAPLIRALADIVEVVVVAERGVSVSRARMGWGSPDYGAAHLVVEPSPDMRARLEAEMAFTGVHVFSGMLTYQQTSSSMMAVIGAGGTVGVFAEPWDPDGVRGIARQLVYRLRARKVQAESSFILTTGELGRHQYSRLGFPITSILDFGYFVDPSPLRSDEGEDCTQRPTRLLVVATLNNTKRVDWVLRAFADIPATDAMLTVVGDGPLRTPLEGLARSLGVGDRVTWLGNRPNEEVRRNMTSADALVLASSYDGWGVVVNEAMHAGTRVIVSNRCGASSSVRSPLQGYTFAASSRSELTRSMQDVVTRGPIRPVERRALAEWSATHISADVASTYLLEAIESTVLGGGPVVPPWRR